MATATAPRKSLFGPGPGAIVGRVRIIASLACLVVLAACDGAECTDGDTRACACDDGRTGVARCQADGTYGACSCTADGDGGRPDAGGERDGGARDAGARDAGARDAATIDAGSSDAGGPDASSRDGGASDAGGADAGLPCDFTGFTPSMTSTAGSADDLSHLMITTGEDLYLELLFAAGAADAPHTFTFTGENYADCHTCLVMDAECNADRSVCGTHYLVQSGTATFTSLSRTMLSGTLTGVRMVEVTIEAPPFFRSTVVPGGRTWCIPSLSFSGSR